MAQPPISPAALKQAMKEALVETLTERGDLFAGVMVEALEDFGLVEAIKEGEQTDPVSRARIFETLEGGA
jgi:hypothetical protein